jgi:glycine betaine/proline transport system ATP-binding protein
MPNSHHLSCKNLWKLYGPSADEFLRRNPNPTNEQVQLAGLVGAVQQAELDIKFGETFVIMGLSGSGKSTLVRCLSRLVDPTIGSLSLDGQDMLNVSKKDLINIRRHKLGMVFQHFALLPHLTVKENILFPLKIQGRDKKTAAARTAEVIELVGLEGREDYFPNQLSGGQQQRVGIARSLASEPELWFLDEPYSALDPLIRREMQDEFIRLQKILKKTIVFITHDFDEAIRLADRIAIMQNGRIIQTDTPEQLLLHPATDYVREFTQLVPRAKVLTIASIMDLELTDTNSEISAAAKVFEVAEQVIKQGSRSAVIDDNGTIIGSVSRDRVVKLLLGSGA